MSEAQFDKAVAIVQDLPKEGPIQPSTDEKLIFYKYYKQATIGDVNTPRPGLLDFTGKAKWDAWKDAEGLPAKDAREKYTQELIKVLKRVDDEQSKKYIAEIEAAA
ncbi:Acbp from Moniliophthora Perniciosa [Tricholoma matsutake]|nr:Acbp from Moniliophthora Perniciosa [Tricholoma matsutake 945]